jgi:hypothetical protein
MNDDILRLDVVVELREGYRLEGNYVAADFMRRWLEDRNVLVEDGKRVLYLDVPIGEFLESEKKLKVDQERFTSWLNGQYKKMGVPLTNRMELFRGSA